MNKCKCRLYERDALRAELAHLKEENHALDQINRDIQTAAAHLDEVLAELARKGEELKITDDLLKEATETIGAVVACCTYNSNDDAKIGIYGIYKKAFTRIDQLITHYNDAVSAGKVSVDVKQDLSDAECEHVNIKGPHSSEPDFDKMPIEKINQYLREHGYDPEKVGLRGQILAEALTKNIIAREIIQRLLADPGGCRFCDFGVLRKPDSPLKGHDEDCPYLAAHAYLDNETSTIVKRELSDAEINELGAQEAEKRGEK